VKKRPKQILFAAVSVLLAVVACETVLQLTCRLVPRIDRTVFPPSQTVPDARLRFRPNPRYLGHDARGYRNPDALERAEIVAMGDSQTYGAGVDGSSAWPRALSRLDGRAVYSMAGPGFGPGHSLLLLDDTLAMSPKVVIEAFYAGNDLFDAFFLAYHQRSLSELQSTDPERVRAIEKAEQEEKLEQKAIRILGAKPDEDRPPGISLRGFLGEHCALYGILRALRRGESRREVATDWASLKAQAMGRAEFFDVVEAGGATKILTPAYRLSVLDADDPRVAEGLRISLECLARMSERLRARGVEFIVLFLPTAELVFEPAASQAGAPLPDAYVRLLACEKAMWRTTREFLAARSIRFVDAAPALQEALKRG
jgi:hypothetical protein